MSKQAFWINFILRLERRFASQWLSTGVKTELIFLLKETVQIGGKSEISRRRQLEVRLPDVVYFCSRELCKSAEKVRSLANVNWESVYPMSWPFSYFCSRELCKSAKQSVISTSTRVLLDPSTRLNNNGHFLIFARGNCKSAKQKWSLSPTSTRSLSTRRQLEVRLPDVMAILLFLLKESANQLTKGDLPCI